MYNCTNSCSIIFEGPVYMYSWCREMIRNYWKLKEVHVVHVSSLQTNKFPWLANNLVDNSNHYLQDYVQVMEIFGWQQIQPTGFIDADLKINFSDHFFLDFGWSACMNQT